ncbi:MAG: GGDEF domain-containing protein [Acidobacteriota bacterium]
MAQVRPSLIRRVLDRIWTPPDPELVDAGLRGEIMIAGIRLLIIVSLLYIPFQLYFEDGSDENIRAILWVSAAALAEALVVYAAVMRSWGRGWIGFFSGVLDVSLVTLTLALFVKLGNPLGATNDLVIFPAYFLAIGATSLRYDWRICALTGAAAVTQYFLLLEYAILVGGLASADVQWGLQVVRMALLVIATGLAITIVDRAREQRRLSTSDRLTGLANRGVFDDSLQRLGALAARSGEPVTVVMMDIDHFKRFNDSYGHLAGDEALRSVARVLEGSFRSTDLLARYGGEEFAGIFPGMDADNAWRRMEQLRARVARAPVSIGKGKSTQVTVSIGVAVWPMDAKTLIDTVAEADRRLYQAKRDGRNRVVASDGPFGRSYGEGLSTGPEPLEELGGAKKSGLATQEMTS